MSKPKKVVKPLKKAKKIVNKQETKPELNEEISDTSEEDNRLVKRAERKSKLSSKLSSKLRSKVDKISKKSSTLTLSTKQHDKIFDKHNIDETAYLCFGNFDAEHPECDTCKGNKKCAKKTK